MRLETKIGYVRGCHVPKENEGLPREECKEDKTGWLVCRCHSDKCNGTALSLLSCSCSKLLSLMLLLLLLEKMI